MTPRSIDHIGIAVHSIAASSRFYRDALGLAIGPVETLPEQGVRVAFVETGAVRIELLEPIDAAGPIARFLARRGEGWHHLAFAVHDVAASLEAASRAGITLIDPVPRRGAHGTRVAFLHPKDLHGVLVELVEHAPGASPSAVRAT